MFERRDTINREISDYFTRLNLNLIDIYLVGSRSSKAEVAGQQQDYDFVIILDAAGDVEGLKERRRHLETIVSAHDAADLYHFKLFDIPELEKLSQYDGFRLYEFQSVNVSCYRTDVIYKYRPTLDRKNFSTSLLIQKVYGRLTNRNYFFNLEEDGKPSQRFDRNNQILALNNLSRYHEQFSDVYQDDDLWGEFNAIRSDEAEWNDFLSRYFKRFRHEFINKEREYRSNLKSFTACSI